MPGGRGHKRTGRMIHHLWQGDPPAGESLLSRHEEGSKSSLTGQRLSWAFVARELSRALSRSSRSFRFIFISASNALSI